MAFTESDFSKIWASTSPLTPYEFTEDNYKSGWNFIGATPPSRQMWDFLQKQNDEKTQWLYNNKLSLSGGTMTGSTAFKGNQTLCFNSDGVASGLGGWIASTDTGLRIIAGEGFGLATGGGRIDLNGRSQGGTVVINVANGTNATQLSLYPSGDITWNGETVAVSDDSSKLVTSAYVKDCVPKSVGGTQRPVYTNANGVITACNSTGSAGGLEGVDSFDLVRGNGYIRYESGLQICWNMTQMTNSGYTWTFPKAFTVIPNVQVTASYGGSFSGTNATRMISWVGNESVTNCKIYSNTDATSNIYKQVIAIGKWK